MSFCRVSARANFEIYNRIILKRNFSVHSPECLLGCEEQQQIIAASSFALMKNISQRMQVNFVALHQWTRSGEKRKKNGKSEMKWFMKRIKMQKKEQERRTVGNV